MKNLGYYNGTFGPLDEMTVPFNDRVHFFGDGVYEACPAHNYVPFALDEHIDRMYRSAAMADIRIPCDKAEMKAITRELIGPKVERYARTLGVEAGKVTVRCQRTLWGSCTKDGNLSFNCLLMLLPPIQ